MTNKNEVGVGNEEILTKIGHLLSGTYYHGGGDALAETKTWDEKLALEIFREILSAKDSAYERVVAENATLRHDFPVGWNETHKRLKEKLSKAKVLEEALEKIAANASSTMSFEMIECEAKEALKCYREGK